MATHLLSQFLPNEMIDIIMKKTHRLNLNMVHSEFNRFVSTRRSELSFNTGPPPLCLIGECECGGPCPEYDDEEAEFQYYDPFSEADPDQILFDIQIPFYIEPRDAYEYIKDRRSEM